MLLALAAVGLLLTTPQALPRAVAESAPRAAAPAQPVILFTVGPRLAVRNVFIKDRLTPGLSRQKSGALSLWAAALEVVPAANKGLPLVSDLAFTGSMSRSIYGAGLGAAENVTGLSGNWIAWDAGARLRLAFAGREWGGLSIKYTSERHDFSGPRPPGVVLPSGTQQAWEPGLDLLLPLGPLTLDLRGGWVLPVTRDAIDEVFPRAVTQGFSLGARLGWVLGEHLEVSLGGRQRRLLHALNPLPHDPYIAGGATDVSTLWDLALTVRG